jgi:hypothetical protein
MDAAPSFERLTGQARRAVWLAYQEAQRFDHDYLASEHLLAGLVREGSAEVVRVFREQQITPDEILERLEMTLAQTQPVSQATAIFLTPRAHRTLAAAIELARQEHATVAGPKHVLLAMLTDAENSTRAFLDDLGFDAPRGEQSLRDAALAPNRDMLVQAAPGGGDNVPIDPTAAQLTQLLAGELPRVLLTAENSPAVDPSLAESDFQLFLTQLILALSLGSSGGYIAFESFDGMVGVAVLFGLAACFRNSVLGMVVGGGLGAMVAQRIHHLNQADTPIGALLPLVLLGGFLGSFVGNFWRRYCPTYLRPSTTRQKPPGVV